MSQARAVSRDPRHHAKDPDDVTLVNRAVTTDRPGTHWTRGAAEGDGRVYVDGEAVLLTHSYFDLGVVGRASLSITNGGVVSADGGAGLYHRSTAGISVPGSALRSDNQPLEIDAGTRLTFLDGGSVSAGDTFDPCGGEVVLDRGRSETAAGRSPIRGF